MTLTTYSIDKMRVTKPKGKTAEKNPDRALTVTGIFYSTEADAKGKLLRKEKLSIAVKYIDHEDKPLCTVNMADGILTIPAGERGRKAEASLTQEEIDALLTEASVESEADPS